MIVRLLADILRESQRVPAVVLAGWAALFAGLLDQAGRRFEALFARREG